jgi:hypothetical protein
MSEGRDVRRLHIRQFRVSHEKGGVMKGFGVDKQMGMSQLIGLPMLLLCCCAFLRTREGGMHIPAARVKRSSEHSHITHTLNLSG